MPFYRVYVGYGISDAACARILANGIPPEIYSTPVRVLNFYRAGYDQTVFEIDAGDDAIAKAWTAALNDAISEVIEYTPVTPENPDPPPSSSNVWARVGTWTKTAGVSTTVISSLPGQPKGLILWGSALEGATFGTNSNAGAVGIGISDGTTNRFMGYGVQDNTSPINAGRICSRSALQIMDPTGTTLGTFAMDNGSATFGATSFTLTWSATTRATQGFYYVFGGDDIEFVKVQDFVTETTSTGTHEYTGFGRKYDFGMFFINFTTGAAGPDFWPNGYNAGALCSVSVHATQTNEKQWVSNIKQADNVATTNAQRTQQTDRMLSSFANGTFSTMQQVARWNGWTNDGFVLDWILAPTGATRAMTGLFVKGGKWDCGSFIQPVSTGTIDVLLAPADSLPQGIMAFSVNNIVYEPGFTNTPARWTVGAQDVNGNKGCLSYDGLHGVSTSDELTVMNNNTFMKYITWATPTVTTNANCSISDMASAGQFTVNFSTADSTPRQTVWFSLST